MSRPITFTGDLSATKASAIIEVPTDQWGNLVASTASAYFGWPAGPIGELSLEESVHGDPAGTWERTTKADGSTLVVTLSGTAGYSHVAEIVVQSPYLRWVWTYTSGGTGKTLSDGGVDTTQPPKIQFSLV